ncbi:MAG: lasso peptide biosynthesis B2 protein [Sphingobium sp.]
MSSSPDSDTLPLDDYHRAHCGEGVVLLDLATDSYLCRYEAGQVSVPMADHASPPSNRWIDPKVQYVHIGISDIAHFVRAYALATVQFYRRPLRSLLEIATRMNSRCNAPDHARTQHLAARFERMSLFLPVRATCLLKCFALLHFLGQHRQAADWIIGVQLFPFRAHCWLAMDNQLLAERAHLLEDYVPILTHCGHAQ